MRPESTSAVLGAAVVALLLPTLLLGVSATVFLQLGAALTIIVPWWMRLPVGSILAMEGTTAVLTRSSGGRVSLGRTSFGLWTAALPIGVGLAMAGTAIATFTILLLPLSEAYLALREAQYEPILQQTSTLVGSVLVFLAVAVVPGIVEERTFRAALLTHCSNWTTTSRAILSGLVFALVHLDPVSFIALILVGITLTVLADCTGGWGIPAAAHAALNAFNTLVWPKWFGTDDLTWLTALVLLPLGLALVGAGMRLVTLLSDARRSASVVSAGAI
jgi:hypothetical protein